jgi:hypothetical protein
MIMCKPKHSDKRCSDDVWVKWDWHRFPGDESHTQSTQESKLREQEEYKAERETDRDLKKPIPQLVADFNMVTQHSLPNEKISLDTKYILQAQKRMVAMMAKVAMENSRTNKVIIILTIFMIILTIIIATLTAILAQRN